MCKCNGNCSRNLPCPDPNVKGHPHAELMMQYAIDAKTNERPWELWEVCENDKLSNWSMLLCPPSWNGDLYYRRKPRYININGYEVPEPIKIEPDSGEQVFYPTLVHGSGVRRIYTKGSDFYRALYLAGCLHTTEEAAELHAKALLSFTRKK